MNASSPNMWCPACGAEYQPGSSYCSGCRVALVQDAPDSLSESRAAIDSDTDLVEIGEFSRLHAQILRRRLESASIPVLIEWSTDQSDVTGLLLTPSEHAEFAQAVITEIDVDDEVPDTSPVAYVARIEEHLAAAAGLLDELRSVLEESD